LGLSRSSLKQRLRMILKRGLHVDADEDRLVMMKPFHVYAHLDTSKAL